MTADLARRVRIVVRQLAGRMIPNEYVVLLDGREIAARISPLTQEDAVAIAAAHITPPRAVVLDWSPKRGNVSAAERDRRKRAADEGFDPEAA